MKPLLGALVLLSLCLTTSAYALDVSISPDRTHIVATLEDGSSWSTLLTPPEQNTTDTQENVSPPIHINQDAVHVCVHDTVYKLRSQDGVVQWRQPVYGECKSFSKDQTGLHVTVHVKSFVGAKDASRDVTLDITPEGLDTPNFWFAVEHIQQNYILHDLAKHVVEQSLHMDHLDYDRETPLCDLAQTPCQDALKNLTIAATQDPTNPSYTAHKLLILHDNKKEHEAREATQQLWNINPSYHPDLLFLHQSLKHRPELYLSLIDTAQKLALSQVIRSGYEPHSNHSLVSIAGTLPSPQKIYTEQELDARQQKNPADYFEQVQVKHVERMNRIAPGFENSTVVYSHLAELAREQDDEGTSQVWTDESKLWSEQGILNVPFSMVNNAGNMIPALSAISLAFLLLLLLKAGRASALTITSEERRDIQWNILNRLNRSELVGLILLPIAAIFALNICAQGILATDIMSKAPFAIQHGQYHHPTAVQWLDQLEEDGHDHGGYTFMRAYSKQLQGNLDEAQALYTKIKDTDARALNNLGIIAHAQQNTTKAQDYFAQALAQDADLQEARYNTQQRDELSNQLIYRHTLDLNIPLVAPPSSEHTMQVIQHHTQTQWSNAMFRAPSSIDENFDSPANLFQSVWTMLILFIILLFIAHAIIFRPTHVAQSQNRLNKIGKASWALSSLFPGASKHWGVVGPLMAATFLWTAFMALTLANNGVSTNVLIAIATPSYSNIFNMDISEAIIAQQGAWLTFAKLWWVFIPINLLFVIAMEIRERRKTV